jgi:hypothetical protein
VLASAAVNRVGRKKSDAVESVKRGQQHPSAAIGLAAHTKENKRESCVLPAASS